MVFKYGHTIARKVLESGLNDTRKEENIMENYLNKKVEDLELHIRTLNVLKALNIDTIRDLVQRTENEMLKQPNFGRKSLNEIREVLNSMSLYLGMEVPEQINGSGEKSPTFFQEYNREVIAKAKQASLDSLKYMSEKEEWNQKEVETLFSEHKKIIDAYEKALYNMFF